MKIKTYQDLGEFIKFPNLKITHQPMTPTKYKSAEETLFANYPLGLQLQVENNPQMKAWILKAMQAYREQTIQQCREVLLKKCEEHNDFFDPPYRGEYIQKEIENLPELMKGENQS